MKRLLAPVLILALVGLGCTLFSPPAPTPPFSATLTVSSTLTVSLTPLPTLPFLASQTPFPTLTSTPTQLGSGVATLPPNFSPTPTFPFTATPPPTLTASSSVTPRPGTTRPAPTPTQPSGQTLRLQIYLIALEDAGLSGPPVGCGDSAVPVTVEVPHTQAVLRAALERLLALDEQYYGQSGLYNALYQSDLEIESLAIRAGVAEIRLVGELRSGGVCDDPRIITQIEQTALQFSTIQTVKILVNGVRIQDILSGRAVEPPGGRV